jgi:hypothetical protein
MAQSPQEKHVSMGMVVISSGDPNIAQPATKLSTTRPMRHDVCKRCLHRFLAAVLLHSAHDGEQQPHPHEESSVIWYRHVRQRRFWSVGHMVSQRGLGPTSFIQTIRFISSRDIR